MSVVIELRFPGGRYHATPWGRHVNEGVPEWPPSPWRLFRALVAVWKRTCPEVSESQVRRIIGHLVEPPRFHLPAFRVAHTRHYMPWEKKGPADRTLVFDTFVSVGREDPVIIGWPDANLSVEDEACLRMLFENLTSFGRAEGWVEANLASLPNPSSEFSWNCIPTLTDSNPMPVLCPDPVSVFADTHYPKLEPKKPAKFLFDCPRWHLCLDTQTIHEERWPSVPGAKWIDYSRPQEPGSVTVKPRVSDSCPQNRPTVVRFLLDGPVLPLVTDTVPLAEAFRKMAMSRFKYWCQKHKSEAKAFQRTDDSEKYSSQTLSGRALDGTMRKDHNHAFYLPTADGDDPRRITHVTVLAPEGFGPAEVAAFNSCRELKWGDKEESKLQVQMVGLGKDTDFNHGLFQQSEVWESVTPFVVHRHFKRRGRKRDILPVGTDWRKEFVLIAAREALIRAGYSETIKLEWIDELPRLPPAIHFRRRRQRAGEPSQSRPFGFLRLTFDKPVSRPTAFGYGCHYGLGQLRPSIRSHE